MIKLKKYYVQNINTSEREISQKCKLEQKTVGGKKLNDKDNVEFLK